LARVVLVLIAVAAVAAVVFAVIGIFLHSSAPRHQVSTAPSSTAVEQGNAHYSTVLTLKRLEAHPNPPGGKSSTVPASLSPFSWPSYPAESAQLIGAWLLGLQFSSWTASTLAWVPKTSEACSSLTHTRVRFPFFKSSPKYSSPPEFPAGTHRNFTHSRCEAEGSQEGLFLPLCVCACVCVCG
jgi:hypothetical protein